MFAFLIPLLAQLPGLIGSFFKQKNDIIAANNAADLQIALANKELASEIAKAQLELGTAALASTGAKFKYFTFFMWFGPYMANLLPFTHQYVINMFTNLSGMPEWYTKSCMIIMFTVWGISVSADTVGNIFSNLGNFFAEKRDHKLAMAKVNRQAYYDALRRSKGSVSPDDVIEGEKVFDQMDKDSAQIGS